MAPKAGRKSRSCELRTSCAPCGGIGKEARRSRRPGIKYCRVVVVFGAAFARDEPRRAACGGIRRCDSRLPDADAIGPVHAVHARREFGYCPWGRAFE